MATKERIIEVSTERFLRQPHHAFLDTMRMYFTPNQYNTLLKITSGKPGGLNPEGDIPVFDEEVIQIVDHVLGRVAEYLPQDNLQQVAAAAYFSIWAHAVTPPS